jgi:hypothetical protein
MKFSALVLALVIVATTRVHAESSGTSAAGETYWTTCTEADNPDCSKRPDSYVWPDSRFALGATLDLIFRHSDNDLFMKTGPAYRIGALFTLDIANIDGGNPGIVGLEGGYRIEQNVASDLFGQDVSTAMTSHDLYAGATYKILSDRSLDPAFGGFVRMVGGVGMGTLVVRDARSAKRYDDFGCAPFLDLGLGIVVRMLGLLLEGGYEFAASREFELAGANDAIEVSRQGFYLRGGVVIHIP